MPRLIITAGAGQGLEPCRQFATAKGSKVARRAAQAIEQQLARFEANPEKGRPFAAAPELRGLIIEFGDSGYVALYRYIAADSAVYLLAFRHQREAGYS